MSRVEEIGMFAVVGLRSGGQAVGRSPGLRSVLSKGLDGRIGRLSACGLNGIRAGKGGALPESRAIDFNGAGFRGGNWNNSTANLCVSDRNNAANTNTNRNNNNGWRGVRRAPWGDSLIYGIIAAGCFLLTLIPLSLFAQTYGGGGYDGYDITAPVSGFGGAPYVVTLAATNVTALSAWMNGELYSTGSAATAVSVYWGTIDGGTNKGAWQNVINFGGCAEQVLTTNKTGLASSTTCYYRFYASNSVADAWAGGSASFTTFQSPVLSAGTGAAPTFNQATLNGNLITGTPANVTIYWGADSNNWANTNILGSLSQGAFLVVASNLTAGSTYYYRCYGTNTWGEGWTPVVTFATWSAFSPSFNGGGNDGYDLFSTNTIMPAIFGGVLFMFF